jgi:ABC-type amino acid transport substrate-binding protein
MAAHRMEMFMQRLPGSRTLIVVTSLLLVTACETFEAQQSLDYAAGEAASPTGDQASLSPFNWSPPNYAGLTAGRIVYPGKEGEAPVVAEWLSGKEAESASITFATPDGNIITYSAGGLRAFEGQLARADVEKALAGELSGLWQNVAPEIKAGLVDAVCLVMTKAPCT